MPNGGHPMHMVLRPRASAVYVVYCRGPKIHLIAARDWENSKGNAQPILTLDAGESTALTRFIGHWVEESAEEQRASPRPNIQYDF